MTIAPFPRVSSQTARQLAIHQLDDWSRTGALHLEELTQTVKEIVRSLRKRSSPAKSLKVAMRKLEVLYSRRDVRGEISLLNSRHINFKLAFPTKSDDGIVFNLLTGEINARTGAVSFDSISPIRMSVHALQRLMERVDERTLAAILDEIYSCIHLAAPWHKAGMEISAKCWPLVSRTGLFIGTGDTGASVTTIITWIKSESIGVKWGLPLGNLIQLKNLRPELLLETNFAMCFIRSFPWMLHEHVPGEDLIGQAWQKRPESQSEPVQIRQQKSNSEPTQEVKGGESEKNFEKISASYLPGMNYKKGPPPFTVYSLHEGIAVQKNEDGSLFVGLSNGWTDKIPCQSLLRGARLIPNYSPPKLGDSVVVYASKINHIAGEDAYAISLDPKEISDANWIETENKYKIGNVCHGTIIAKRTWEYVVQLVSGIRGLLPARELNTYVRNLSSPPHEVIGLELEVVVSGYRAEKRFLSLSIEGTRALSSCQLSNNYVGEKSSGVCAYKTLSYSLIEIQPDTYGILHKLNTWGDELPEVGEPVSVIIAGIENSQIFLTKEPRRVLDRIFFARPSLKEKWDVVINDYPVGRSAELQILYWRETNQSYMVVTQDGVVGFLPGKEIGWRCTSLEEQRHVFNPGDTLHAAVLKVKQTKKHLVFSKKYLDKNSIDEHFLLLSLEKPIEGVIVKTVDFGCFVSLLPSGIQALLHRSKIPVGRTFSEGQSYMFYIDSLDQVNKRVSVRLNEP